LKLAAWTVAFCSILTGSYARPAPTRETVWEWTDVPRIVAVGDIHGTIDKLVLILRATGLVDADLKWSGGRTHLVLCGDLIDRGPADRAVLELVRRLNSEAPEGGRPGSRGAGQPRADERRR
jgi:hypothetical protein